MRHEENTSLSGRLLSANLAWIAAGILLGAGSSLPAQEARTGVSVPQPVLADSSEAAPDATQPPAKPSAAIPVSPQAEGPAVYGPYVPYKPAGSTTEPASPAQKPFDPDANIVTEDSIHRRPLTPDAPDAADPDAGIVTHVPTHPGEISEGTLIRTRLDQTISTLKTQPGSRFTAVLYEPVTQDGRVYIPQGSILQGRVSSLHGGKRIGGGAAIHLETDSVTLPDGTVYPLRARVIDTLSWENTIVDNEGTILRRESVKHAVEAGGLAAGAGMAAGAIVAGPAGALVGAGIGAGATAVVWFKQDREAELPKDLGVIFSLSEPLDVASQPSLPVTAASPHLPGE